MVIATFRLAAGCKGEFLELLKAHAARSLAEEPGCLRFDVLLPTDQYPEHAEQVMLYEVYSSPAAFADHRETARYAAFFEAAGLEYTS